MTPAQAIAKAKGTKVDRIKNSPYYRVEKPSKKALGKAWNAIQAATNTVTPVMEPFFLCDMSYEWQQLSGSFSDTGEIWMTDEEAIRQAKESWNELLNGGADSADNEPG